VQKQLVTVAHTNAKYALENAKRAGAGHGIAALEEIADKLGLKQIPRRIECYDISNTQGEESVASRVVFVDGAPDKNLYRRYKIKTVIGANDFASMKEIFERRFSKMDQDVGNERPDLVVVDGGKGQLAQAEAIFNRVNPIPLYPHTKAYKLLTHIRDEAHRFAITYHRLRRDKRSLQE
jgi:excinuclease ABC subunit C